MGYAGEDLVPASCVIPSSNTVKQRHQKGRFSPTIARYSNRMVYQMKTAVLKLSHMLATTLPHLEEGTRFPITAHKGERFPVFPSMPLLRRPPGSHPLAGGLVFPHDTTLYYRTGNQNSKARSAGETNAPRKFADDRSTPQTPTVQDCQQ